MTFEEAKQYLLEYYSKKGFNKIVIDKETSWMLKNKDINNAYIHLTNKGSLKIELFNIPALFEKEKFSNIEIIENIEKEFLDSNLDNEHIDINEKIDQELQIKIDSVLVTTETCIDLPIEKRLGIASAQCVYGLNIIKDFFTGIRNIVGGRIKSIENPLDEARQEIINTLKEKTYLSGGNAIIGIKIEHTYNNADAANMVSMFGTGTMVKLSTPNN